MKELKELLKKPLQKINEKKIEKIFEKIDIFFDKNKNKLLYEDIEKLYIDIENLCNDFLTQDEAERAVNAFVNTDGTTGGHWPLQIIKNTLEQRKIPLQTDKYNLYDLYFMINMIYSDSSKVVRDNVDIIIEQAICKLENPDFYAGGKSYSKAYVEWKEYLKKEYGDKKL